MSEYLSRDNPRLCELEEWHRPDTLLDTRQWESFAAGIDIQNFRGEPGYLSQLWNMSEERYQNTYDYLIHLGLEDEIRKLGEDGAFGAITFRRKETGLPFSRDLIDSLLEIRFLKETLSLFWSFAAPFRVLDIGAGYGRFAYRLCQSHPLVQVGCTDAIPLSLFLCEYYLKYREIYRSAIYLPERTLPGDKRDAILQGPQDYIMACNHYSFSEMPLASVEFWLKLCAEMNILYFFLVPHSGDLIHGHFVTSEPDGSHRNYLHLFEKYGYTCIEKQSKFPASWPKPLIYGTDYLLFKRGGV